MINKSLFFSVLYFLTIISYGCANSDQSHKQPNNITSPIPNKSQQQSLEFYPIQKIDKSSAIYQWGRLEIADTKNIIDSISNKGFNILYLDLEPYLNSGEESYIDIEKIVNYANQKNIQIHALLGAPNFAELSQKSIVFNGFKFITKYNSTIGRKNPISGLHLNIEHYNIGDYKTNKVTYTINFINFIKEISD
jgi:hypothetical protein